MVSKLETVTALQILRQVEISELDTSDSQAQGIIAGIDQIIQIIKSNERSCIIKVTNDSPDFIEGFEQGMSKAQTTIESFIDRENYFIDVEPVE